MKIEMLLTRRLGKLGAVLLFSLLLAACGAGEDEEPAASTAPADAQPTIVDDEGTSEAASTSVPTNVDMSAVSPGASPAPTSDEATPGAVTPGASPAAPRPRLQPASSDGGPESIPADVDVGDGTTGAMVIGTPLATPGVSASPVASPASPVAGASPMAANTVSSCDVAVVPPFSGETTSYRLTTDLNFRDGPGSDCGFATQQPIGQFLVVEVTGGPVLRADEDTEWVRIRALGTEGWVVFEFLEPVDE